MEMIKNEYLTNLHGISTDIVRMHMDPEFWYQQHNLDSDAHHLNNHMIDMVQKYMSLLYEGRCNPNGNAHRAWFNGIRVQTLQGNICPKQTDHGCYSIYACRFYDLPDDTRNSASVNSPKQKIKLLGDVTKDDSEQSLQTISLILILEGTGTQYINQRPYSRLTRRNLQTG
jgi:hypothetical protein